jgi:hypothetical protein
MPPPPSTETGFSPVASKALPICKHEHSQSTSQDGLQNSQAPSHIANCQASSSHLCIFFEDHNEAGIHTHANCKHQKQPFIIAQSLQTSQASYHHKILCKPAKPVIITRSFANQLNQSSSQDLCKTATHQHQKVTLRLICM